MANYCTAASGAVAQAAGQRRFDADAGPIAQAEGKGRRAGAGASRSGIHDHRFGAGTQSQHAVDDRDIGLEVIEGGKGQFAKDQAHGQSGICEVLHVATETVEDVIRLGLSFACQDNRVQPIAFSKRPGLNEVGFIGREGLAQVGQGDLCFWVFERGVDGRAHFLEQGPPLRFVVHLVHHGVNVNARHEIEEGIAGQAHGGDRQAPRGGVEGQVLHFDCGPEFGRQGEAHAGQLDVCAAEQAGVLLGGHHPIFAGAALFHPAFQFFVAHFEPGGVIGAGGAFEHIEVSPGRDLPDDFTRLAGGGAHPVGVGRGVADAPLAPGHEHAGQGVGAGIGADSLRQGCQAGHRDGCGRRQADRLRVGDGIIAAEGFLCPAGGLRRRSRFGGRPAAGCGQKGQDEQGGEK